MHQKNKNKNSDKDKNATTVEKITFKGISKEDAHTLVGQMANFAKIYANIEGFSVMDGSQQGGILLRSVGKVFEDVKYVSSHPFTDLVFKIREYTKRDATLNGDLFNFAQIVENEGTLEREVLFDETIWIIPQSSMLFDHDLHLSTLDENEVNHFDYDDFVMGDDGAGADGEQNKLCVTNMSRECSIAMLVEMEQNRENRQEMFERLERSSTGDNYNSFLENGFVIIDRNGGKHTFKSVNLEISMCYNNRNCESR